MAQRGLNRVNLIGRLTRDPEIKVLENGKLAILSVVTSENWKDKTTGEQKEITEYHRVNVFGSTAQFLETYAKKGTMVYVEAQLKTRKWQDENGKDVYNLDIVVQGFNGSVQMLSSSNKDDSQEGAPAPSAPAQSAPTQSAPAQSAPAQSAPPVDDEDEDIPF